MAQVYVRTQAARVALASRAPAGKLERRYERWFLRRLPHSNVSLDLPMSPQLEVLLRLQSSGAEVE